MNHPTVRCLRICKLRFVKTESFIITSHIFVLYVICLHIRWRWAHVLRVSFTCSLGILVNLCRYFSISFYLILKSVMGFAYHNKFFFHVCPFIFVHVSSFQLFFNFDVNCFQWFYPDFIGVHSCNTCTFIWCRFSECRLIDSFIFAYQKSPVLNSFDSSLVIFAYPRKFFSES